MDPIRLLLVLGCAFIPLALACRSGAQTPSPAPRQPKFAGSWYEGTKERLARQMDGFFEKAPDRKTDGRVLALISPHAGVVYSGQTAAYGYKLLKNQKVTRVILLGPSHRAPLQGASIATATEFATPLGAVRLDRAVCDKLVASGVFKADPTNEGMEHSLEIQLPFLQEALGKFLLVPIMVGSLGRGDAEAFAQALKPFIDETTVLVASSDFTHYGADYGYVPFDKDVPENLRTLDEGAAAYILKIDADGFIGYVRKTGDTICGFHPIEIVLRCLSADARAEVLHYARSAELTGDFSTSVSYFSIGFFTPKAGAKNDMSNQQEKGFSATAQQKLLAIARRSVEAAVRGQAVPPAETDDPELKLHRGAFVTLTNRGALRGCIGNFEPDQAVAEVVRDMGIASATQDYRFASNPITAKELASIEIEISVLSPRKRIQNPLDLVIGRDGIYIKRGNRAGTFLPQVATEYNMSKEEFLSTCCSQKAGLPAEAWKDPQTEVYTYTAQIFQERAKANEK